LEISISLVSAGSTNAWRDGLHSDGSIETDIWIERPPEDVWKVLTATPSYGSCNPMISRLGAELREGKNDRLRCGTLPAREWFFTQPFSLPNSEEN
jgi:hypothetical protein